jgi:phosphatidylserine/phosphatidylglycerophosphate/cardiolipin synthase-like enzyme
VRLRGPAAARVHDYLAQRWSESASLPARWFQHRRSPRLSRLNPRQPAAALPDASAQAPRSSPGTAVRVLRSVPPAKVTSVVPGRRRPWQSLPATGVHEIYATIVAALAAARRYVYLEDQYLMEYLGGRRDFELYRYLRDAARRGVRVVLVGSGVRDPEDPGVHLRAINRDLNRDLKRKIVDRLSPQEAQQFAVHRIEHLTVHAKLILVDDVFACIGSANMFSRSMVGTDSEVSTAIATSTTVVRDLRVRLWAEHLRTPVTADLRPALEDIDLALGLWRPEWVPAPYPASTWRGRGSPAGFDPLESVRRTVWP